LEGSFFELRSSVSSDLERRLLEAIEENPDTTQANLAAQLGVAVGSVNWYVKRLIRKGYVKVTHLQRRKLKYFITPQGLALKARLTSQYLEASLRVYRELRLAARQTLAKIESEGYNAVHLDGDGEAMEILRLTCLEQRIRPAAQAVEGIPTARADGTAFVVSWPSSSPDRGGRQPKTTEVRRGN
jgi:DNA-binding MarR family transcriptional regulator